MKKLMVSVMFVLVLLVTLVTAACAKATPTPTQTATPGPTPTGTPKPTPTLATPSPTPEKVYEFDYISPWTLSTFPYVKPWLEELEARSGGRLKITVFEPGEHPYKQADMLSVIEEGLGDIGGVNGMWIGTTEPLIMLVEMPFMLVGVEEMYDLLEDADYADVRQKTVYDTHGRHNQQVLWYSGSQGYMFALKDKFITDWDSLKGVKVRVANEEQAKMVSTMNGTPVTVSWAEVYPALQRGVADALTTSTMGAYSKKLYELVKYITITDHTVGLKEWMINDDALASLPADLQNIILEVSTEQLAKAESYIMQYDAMTTMWSMRDFGASVRVLNPKLREEFRAAMSPIWDDWVKRAGPDAAGLLARAQSFHAEWMQTEHPKVFYPPEVPSK